MSVEIFAEIDDGASREILVTVNQSRHVDAATFITTTRLHSFLHASQLVSHFASAIGHLIILFHFVVYREILRDHGGYF